VTVAAPACLAPPAISPMRFRRCGYQTALRQSSTRTAHDIEPGLIRRTGFHKSLGLEPWTFVDPA
jgi:hypothetical protein